MDYQKPFFAASLSRLLSTLRPRALLLGWFVWVAAFAATAGTVRPTVALEDLPAPTAGYYILKKQLEKEGCKVVSGAENFLKQPVDIKFSGQRVPNAHLVLVKFEGCKGVNQMGKTWGAVGAVFGKQSGKILALSNRVELADIKKMWANERGFIIEGVVSGAGGDECCSSILVRQFFELKGKDWLMVRTQVLRRPVN